MRTKTNKNKKRVRLNYIPGVNTIDYYRGKWEVAPSNEDKLVNRATWDGKGYYDQVNRHYVYVSK